jgi:cytochrome bd-type quinol oxidase subunit 1
MLTKVIKWSAIAALIGGTLSRSLPGLGLVLQFAVSAAAVIVVIQAANMRQYVWMTLFLAVACLFNPVFPISFSHYTTGVVTTFAVLLFFFSLELLKPKPRLSIASKTDRMPGSESL